MPPPIVTRASISHIESPTDTVRKIHLQPEMPIPFRAGQFVLLNHTTADGSSIERSYSIANAPAKDNHLEFVIRLVPNGAMSTVIKTIRIGQEVTIKGAFGRFGEIGSDLKNGIICIAGGVGISPIRSIIQSQIASSNHPPLSLFWGFRTPKDYLFQSELEQYKAQGHLQRLEVSISDESSDWSGHKGYCHHLVQQQLRVVSEKAIFICGPPPMVDETKKVLLEMGFNRKQIHLEAW